MLAVICLFLMFIPMSLLLLDSCLPLYFSALFLVEGRNKNLGNTLFPGSFGILPPSVDNQIFTPLPPLASENCSSLYPMCQFIITLSYFYVHDKSNSVTVNFSEVI